MAKKTPNVPTKAALAKTLKAKADAIHAAAAVPLSSIPGVKVHTILFSVESDAVIGHCNPPCRANEQCLLRSSGGDVTWVCVPV